MEISLGFLILILSLLLLVFLVSGMHITFALMVVGIIGFYVFVPRTVTGDISRQAWNITNSSTLTASVLYIFMGELILRGGVSEIIYESLDKWLGRLPGGLLHSVIGFCSIFAAVSGSSVATAAMIGTVAIPSIKKRNYDRKLMYGSMAAGGTLGILIPPSIIMIIYGALTGVSIAKCFFGGMVPGIILSLLFIGYVMIRVIRTPSLAPAIGQDITWKDRVRALVGIAPVGLLAVFILGGIYLGLWTPTESAAIGCLGTIVMIIAQRKMTWSVLTNSLRGALYTSSMILMVTAGAAIISYVISYLRVPTLLIEYVAYLGLSRYLVLGLVCISYIIMGCFIEGICMVVITIPIVFPVMVALGFDPVWLGIILVILIEVGLITPPVGMNLFVIKGVDPESKFEEIFMGAMPFVVIMIVMIIALTVFPGLATWLPNMMAKGGEF